MALQSYKETLTQLRNNIEGIRGVLNQNGLNGNDPMNTWPSQVNNLIESAGSLLLQVEEDNSNFDNIYNAIVQKGQNPVYTDRSTYAGAILAIGGESES